MQANNALRSILGPAASLQASGVYVPPLVTREQFVQAILKATGSAVPYKKSQA